MSYLLNLSSTPGSSVTKEFDPPLDMTIQVKADCHVPLSPEEAAEWVSSRVLRISERRRKGGAPAILGWLTGPFLVCETVRQKLESLAPGSCGFKSFEILGLSEKLREHSYGTYYWVFPPSLNAVVIEETDFTKGRGREGYGRSAGRISLLPGTRCVIDARIVENRHFWRLPDDFGADPDDTAGAGCGAYFCSDELHDFIKAERLDGWSFDKKCMDQTA